MIIVIFSVINIAHRVLFFRKTFLIANINLNIVFRMLFLILRNDNIDYIN